MFGDFDKTDYDIEDQTIVGPLLFFVVTSILPLLLLNLVIAIMSDTYEKVMTNIYESDNMTLNTMIL